MGGKQVMRKAISFVVMAGALLGTSGAFAYPLDASEKTGINRLEAYFRAQDILVEMGRMAPGALKASETVQPQLVNRPHMTLGESDPTFLADLRAVRLPRCWYPPRAHSRAAPQAERDSPS